MPFHPRLPTFNTPVVWFQYDPIANDYTEQSPLTGQVYTPSRTQDDQSGGLLYFVYPKGEDVLHDPYDYGSLGGQADVMKIEYPTSSGLFRGYRVREILPRWLGFTNEHLMAVLQRISAAELTSVEGGSGLIVIEGNWTAQTAATDGSGIPWTLTGDNIASVELDVATVPFSDLLHYSLPSSILPPGAIPVRFEQDLYYGETTITPTGLGEFNNMLLYRTDTNSFVEFATFPTPFPSPEENHTFTAVWPAAGFDFDRDEWNSGLIKMALAAGLISPFTPPTDLRVQHDVGHRIFYHT